MSINDSKNKMMTSPPAKKQFFFAATAEHFAEVIYAETIQQAEQTYHTVKRLIKPVPVESSSSTAEAADEAPLSTVQAPTEEEDVQ
jgi:hypothetical protein